MKRSLTSSERFLLGLCLGVLAIVGLMFSVRDFRARKAAAEELIAELGAAFLCSDLAITTEPRPDHAQYISSWLQVLRNDKKAIFTAASAASKAVEFLRTTS